MKYLIATLLLCQLIQGIVLKSDKNQQCPKFGCKQITPIIDRVAKLAALPDFVSQTLVLLEDLVKEMQKELEKSAEYLIENVEQKCGSVHSSLRKILKMKSTNEERRAKHLEIGMGVEPLTNHNEKPKVISQSNRRNDKDTYQKNYNEDNYSGSNERYEGGQSSGSRSENIDEGEWQSGSWKPTKRPRYDSKKYSSSSHKKTDGYSKVKYYGDKYDRDYSSESKEESGRSFQTGSWNQKSDKKEDAWSQSYDKAYDDYDYRTAESQWGPPKVIPSTNFHRGQKKFEVNEGSLFAKKKEIPCRGVDSSSPFWVPGLDGWCVKNCAAGYCPETHCIC